MKSALIIAYYFPPLGMGGVQRVTKWAKYLPQFGWQPYIVTVKNIQYYAYDPTLLEDVPNCFVYRTGSFDPARILAKFRKHKSDIKNEKLFFPKWGTHATRQFFLPDSKIGWYPFAWRKLVQIAGCIHPEVVISTSPPLTAHLLGMRFHKSYSVPWVVDFRDYWLKGEYVHFPTAIHRYFHERWAKNVVQLADAVITISDPIRQSFLSLDTDHQNKFYNIFNGFDPGDFEKVVPEKFSKKTLLYVGSTGGANDPTPFFRGIENLLKRKPKALQEWQILFVGQSISELAIPKNIRPFLQFVPYLPHKKAVAFLKGATALIFTLAPDVNSGMVTGKIFEYIASARPIFAIVPERTTATELLQSYNFGELITNFDEMTISEKLENFLKRDFTTEGPKSSKIFKQKYSRKYQTETLANILNKVSGR